MSTTKSLADYGDPTDRTTAERLEADDVLAKYKSQFIITNPELCYLDGNSLGRLPRATVAAVTEFMVREWGHELVDGWSHWIDEAQPTGDLLGRATLGAAAGQVLVCDTTSVNFYQLCVAAIKARPGRKTVIIDSANFPTDRYILAGIAEQFGLNLITLNNDGMGGPGSVEVDADCELITPEILEPFMNDDVALVTLQVIHYRSGSRPQVKAITDLVRSHGGLVVWDAYTRPAPSTFSLTIGASTSRLAAPINTATQAPVHQPGSMFLRAFRANYACQFRDGSPKTTSSQWVRSSSQTARFAAFRLRARASWVFAA
jgi:kynureninase